MTRKELVKLHNDLHKAQEFLKAHAFQDAGDACIEVMEGIEQAIKHVPQDEPKIGIHESFEVRSFTMEATLKELGHMLAMITPKELGYTLLLYEYGDAGGNLFYISTAARKETIELMKEFINKQPEPGSQ